MYHPAFLGWVLVVTGPFGHDGRALALRAGPAGNAAPTDELQRSAGALLRDVAGSLDRQLLDVDNAAYDQPQERLVVVTSSNGKYTALTQNLYSSMKKVGRSKLVVFCEDAPCERALRGQGMLVVRTGNNFAEAGEYDSPGFNLITGRKPVYLFWFLSRGYTVLWTDSDVSWLSDPVPPLASMNASFVTQDDSRLRGDERSAVPLTAGVRLRKANTGFFLARPTSLGRRLAAAWLLDMGRALGDPKLQDQRVFQGAFRSSCLNICSEELGACGPKSDCVLLSRERCPNGSVPKWRWSKQALAYHANWHNGISAKVEQMKQKGLW
eukprot:CAMPEP_0204586152 /NCGR_PEP_ID=MMETSP0661-20131031/47328_1 /ASSEMBLY_ACC=CAM_ASM_000606 /TAXON_ID=109239 /ORGANISM="Alexandrium margalefi, Strain AMGDE01CS-322" /LENGTH=323 /DNA_ID=CAMNT_0051595773 /DNA_START=52 /DNA_END=1020 /DNA_ORIENTATION=-